MNLSAESQSLLINFFDPPTLEKIDAFKDFPERWNFGEGAQFNESVIEVAKQLVYFATTRSFFETDAFPGTNGEVMVTVYSGEHYLEFTVQPNLSVVFYHERGDMEMAYQEGLSLVDVQTIMDDFRTNRWIASDSLIESTTGTEERSDLIDSPLVTWGTHQVYLSLIETAFSRPITRFVDIS